MQRIKPLYVVNNAGGIMAWENWLKKPTPDAPTHLAAMVFEDGWAVDAQGTVGRVSTDMRRNSELFRGRAA